MKLKLLSELGMERVNHTVQHKSHVPKVMMAVTSGYLVDGDITVGGRAVKIDFARVGRMEAASKDSYKAVWTDAGQRTHPKVPENKLRNKGEMYFKGMNVTGVKEGTAKKPTWSLKVYLRDEMIPELEKLAEELHCIIRWQWDGAGPHADAELIEWVEAEFLKRGWIFKFQPAQSPITNTMDQCVFPSLSKSQSKAQTMATGKRCLREEEIWTAAKAAWERMPLATIARAYASHMQIVAAIIDHEGSNGFLRDKGHGHYGVRKAYVESDDGEGVCLLRDEYAADTGSELLKYEMMCKSDATYSFNEMEHAWVQKRGRELWLMKKCFCALKE